MGFYPATANQNILGNLAVLGNISASGTINGVTFPVQDPWLPPDNSLKASAGDLDAYLNSNTGAITAGTLYLSKIQIRQNLTATNVVIAIESAGSGTSSGSFAGLYASTGSLIEGSADIGTSLTATGLATLALSSPQSLTSGTFVWAAVVVNLATTQPSLYRNGGSGTITESNGGLTAATYRFAVNGTSLSSLPSSITPTSNTGTGAYPIWMAIS